MANTYYQQLGQNKRIWVRQNDTRPRAEVRLILSDDGTDEDISSGVGLIEVYKSDGTTLLSGNALDMTNGLTGRARYNWGQGELNTIGTYKVIFRISKNNDGNYFSVPEEPFEFVLRVI